MSYQIARDGEQLGSFTEEELVDAVEQGTIRITDMAWTEGMDEWEPVETLIEIEEIEDASDNGEALPPDGPSAPVPATVRPLGQVPHAASHHTAPPAGHVMAPSPYAQPPPQMTRGSGYTPMQGRYGPAGSAIASLVLGILSLVLLFLTGIPAIICGHTARNKIRRSGGAFSGHGMAVAGLVLGYVMTVLGFLLVAYALAGGLSLVKASNL